MAVIQATSVEGGVLRRLTFVLHDQARHRSYRDSGWTYAPWRGKFYPKGLVHKRELAFAAGHFPSIEINGTFYSLQRPQSFARWAVETPKDFVFAIKAPRYITHIRRLKNIEAPMANFFASGVLELGRKLGPILWQFPPNFVFNEALFDAFAAMLPRDTHAAAALARHHDTRMNGRSSFKTGAKCKLRHAVEIRHDSFRSEAFITLLRRHRVALVCADTVEWPRLMDLTSDFIYCRLHGSEELYASGYDDDALDTWARRVRAWRNRATGHQCRNRAATCQITACVARRLPLFRQRREGQGAGRCGVPDRAGRGLRARPYFDDSEGLPAPIFPDDGRRRHARRAMSREEGLRRNAPLRRKRDQGAGV